MAKRNNIIGLVWQILLALIIVLIDRATKLYVIGNCALGE